MTSIPEKLLQFRPHRSESVDYFTAMVVCLQHEWVPEDGVTRMETSFLTGVRNGNSQSWYVSSP